MLLVVNPKAWGMAVGVAGSFSTLSDSPFKLALIFGSVFLLAAGISLSAWVQMGFALSKLLSAEWQWHAFNGVMASLLALSITSLWI
jgi:threonine/homoserine/homoserine lactone efflux protein